MSTDQNPRPLNISRILRARRAFLREYEESGVVGLSCLHIQIEPAFASQVAPLSEWKPASECKLYIHWRVQAHGVQWVSLTTKADGEVLS